MVPHVGERVDARVLALQHEREEVGLPQPARPRALEAPRRPPACGPIDTLTVTSPAVRWSASWMWS